MARPATVPDTVQTDEPAETTSVDTLSAETMGINPNPDAGPDLSDAPKLRPLLHMPYKERAQLMRAFKTLMPRLQALQEAQATDPTVNNPTDPTAVNYDVVAEMYEAFDQIEQVLALAAVDPQEWAAWPGKYEDQKLSALFTQYMERFQAPEASSSPA